MNKLIRDIKKAIRYNLRQRGRLWSQTDIPWGCHDAGGRKFAVNTAAFQGSRGLKVDGMLGPLTLHAIQCNAPEVVADQGFLVDGKVFGVGKALEQFGTVMGAPFKARKRAKAPTHVVIHESVTTSKESTEEILRGKGYGVHFLIEGDGTVTQYNDPITDQVVHANQLNSSSVGIEIVNPYYPKLMRAPWIVQEPAKWWTHVLKDGEAFWVCATDRQVAACRALVLWLTSRIESIPLEFPTKHLNSRKTRIKGWKDKAKPKPGIVAHRDFASHADGRGILEQLFELEKSEV